jgi:hypothetical protein
LPTRDAVRAAVIAVNHYWAEDASKLRARTNLIGSVPELAVSAALHYDNWERAVSDFVAHRTGQPADSMLPLAVGRATLAVRRAGYERWASRADAELTVYLDAGLRSLADGFRDEAAHRERDMP